MPLGGVTLSAVDGNSVSVGHSQWTPGYQCSAYFIRSLSGRTIIAFYRAAFQADFAAAKGADGTSDGLL